jgi:hypothetical protein
MQERHFPEWLHRDILNAVGLTLETVPAKKKRDPAFRQRVLTAGVPLSGSETTANRWKASNSLDRWVAWRTATKMPTVMTVWFTIFSETQANPLSWVNWAAKRFKASRSPCVPIGLRPKP